MANEREIIERLRARVRRNSGPLVLGIGDDCAIYRPGKGRELLFTTDFAIEGVHFRRDTHTAAQIGYKALARGLSDIAAMGGEPQFCLVSLAVPHDAGVRWIQRFYSGLLELADATGTQLAGGDLARSDRLICDVVVCGSAPTGTALRRSGARPGDGIYVSGLLGGSALGLSTGKGAPWARHLRPEPRVALGRFLRTRVHATAAMDLSDGLSIDLQRLCEESGVSAQIEPPPRFPGASADQALHGGEDYELLFTANPEAAVPRRFKGLLLTRIGQVIAGPGGNVYCDGKSVRSGGFDHFARGRKSAKELP